MGATPWVDTTQQAITGIVDGASVSVSGFHLTRAPMALLAALVAARRRGLTYIAWGGGVPLEHLLAAGAVDQAIMCFSSLDVFGLAPRFRHAVESGALELDEWSALGLMTALRAAAENLPTGLLQAPDGSDLAAGFTTPVAGDPSAIPVVSVPALRPDVFLLHAQRADDAGNVEIAGARGLDMSTMFAARRVVVSVEERVPVGQLGAPRAFVLPRTHVDAVCLAPGGAHPTSCLPYYTADLSAVGRLTDPSAAIDVPVEPSAARLDELRTQAAVSRQALVDGLARHAAAPPAGPHAAAVTDPAAPAATVAAAPAAAGRGTRGAGSAADQMVALIARTIDDASICTVGSGAPLAATAYLVAKAGWAPGLYLMSHNGGLLDVPWRPMTLTYAEALDHRDAVTHAGGDETYRWHYQAGRITHEVVGTAQIDGAGRTNTIRINRPDGRFIRLPGQGGMADVANLHRDFVIYLPIHDRHTTPAAVDVAGAARTWQDPDRRRAWGLQPGVTRLITELCVMELDPDRGCFVLVSLHPGVTLDHVRDRTGFPVITDGAPAVSEPPTRKELDLLERVDPLGLRYLEFLKGADRAAFLEQTLELERRIALQAAAAAGQERSRL